MRRVIGAFFLVIGFLVFLYLFGIPVSGVFYRILENFLILWPLVLVVVGFYLLFLGLRKRYFYWFSIVTLLVFFALVFFWPKSEQKATKFRFNGVEEMEVRGGHFVVNLSETGEKVFEVLIGEGVVLEWNGRKLTVLCEDTRKLSEAFLPKEVTVSIPKGEDLSLTLKEGVFTVKGNFTSNPIRHVEQENSVTSFVLSFTEEVPPMYFFSKNCLTGLFFNLPKGTSYHLTERLSLVWPFRDKDLINSGQTPNLFMKFENSVGVVFLSTQ